MRKYAFGDLSVPRDDTQYLKIKYPARYPALPEVSFMHQHKKIHKTWPKNGTGVGVNGQTDGWTGRPISRRRGSLVCFTP